MMTPGNGSSTFDILLIEDDPANTLLALEALREIRLHLKAHNVRSPAEALAFLRREDPFTNTVRPDLILVELDSANTDGREIIGEIKRDPQFRRIPLVVLTTSQTQEDILRCYDLGANCCIARPAAWDEFERTIGKTMDYWLAQSILPSERLLSRQPEPIRLLLIEDDPADARRVKEMLQGEDGGSVVFVVTEADTLQAGADHMEREEFDAVLLDLTLPDGNGADSLDRISARSSRVPILVLTGDPDDAMATSAMRRGAQDFLVKGQFDATALARAVRHAIERSRWRNYIDHLAHHDSLTRLPNRTLFRDRLSLALEQAHRNRQDLAVLFMDLDRFKTVNDTLGHTVGDVLLECVAERLKAAVRASDTVARVGGDEFTLLLPDIGGLEHILVVGEKILSAVRAPYLIGPHQVTTSASIGASLYPSDGEDAETLLKHADAAMYRAKQQGRNALEFYSRPAGVRLTGRGALAQELRQAIEKRELILHYQPLIDTGGKVVSMEALVRWRHPEWGLIYPRQFLPMAEDTGLILDIGEWVLRSACSDRRGWQDGPARTPRVSVNLSNRQLHQGRSLVDSLARALSETGLEPPCVEVEVTEDALAQDENITIQTLRELSDMGVSVSIDDYGTGYSSLSRLRRFPIRSVKIGRSFVRSVTDSADDATLVTAMIAVGHGLKLNVTAVGVETGEQKAFLVEREIDEMQGYFIGKPLPLVACQAYLASGPHQES
jgi:diguanylate cyclase (GGDEF)-like protein